MKFNLAILCITAAVMGGTSTAIVEAKDPSPAAPAQFDQQPYERPAAPWRDIEDSDPAAKECHDRIRRVRAESGLPELDRRPASPEEPLFIKAVDQRVDGCPALVMARDTSDIRPVPDSEESEAGLIPAQRSGDQ